MAPVVNESANPTDEDQEEGEISDKDQASPDEKVSIEKSDRPPRKDIPLLLKRVSLTDLVARGELRSGTPRTRIRNEYSSREGRDIMVRDVERLEDDELERERISWSGEDNPWISPAAYRPPNNNYAPNLYNFAWAQAVQGRSSFSPVDPPGNGSVKKEDSAAAIPGFRGSYDGDWQDAIPDSLDEMTLGAEARYETQRLQLESSLVRSGSWKGGRNSDAVNLSSLRDRMSVEDEGEQVFVPGEKLKSEKGANERGERGRRKGSLQPNASGEESGRSDKISSRPAGQVHVTDIAAEDREEGELEEGEIELPSQPARSRSSSLERSEGLRVSEPEDDRLSEGGVHDRGTDIGKVPVRSMYKSQQSQSRLLPKDLSLRRRHDDDDINWLARAAENERREQLASVRALVKNVTVKDAQKSFISMCSRLYKALKTLEELNKQRQDQHDGQAEASLQDVSNLADKAFQGIRAVYAVWNTASGREQERDKDTFPRLLELVNGPCSKLFTPKQARELREFMDQLTKAGRKTRPEAGDRQFFHVHKPSSNHFQEESRHGLPLGIINSSANPQLEGSGPCPSSEAESTAEMMARRLGSGNYAGTKLAADAAAIAAAAIAYAQSSAAAFANTPHGIAYNKPMSCFPEKVQGTWGWDGRGPSYEQTLYSSAGQTPGQLVGPRDLELQSGMAKSFRGSLAEEPTLVNRASDNVIMPSGFTKAPYVHESFEEDWEELSPPGVGFSGFTSSYATPMQNAHAGGVSSNSRYWPFVSDSTSVTPSLKETLAVTSSFASNRLPSPTPSEDDDDEAWAGKKPPAVHSTDLTNKKVVRLETTPAPIMEDYLTTLNPHISKTGRAYFTTLPMAVETSAELELLRQSAVANKSNRETDQFESMPVSGQAKANWNSRDPRRQFQQTCLESEASNGHLHGPSMRQMAETVPSVLFPPIRKREAPDGESMPTVFTAKRLKISGVDNEAPVSELLLGAPASGGWLEDNTCIGYPMVEDGPTDMDVDTNDALTEVKILAGTHLPEPGLRTLENDTNKAVVNKMEATTRERMEELDYQLTESGVGGKHRMRPRDPRRFLLESTVDRIEHPSSSSPIRESKEGTDISEINKGRAETVDSLVMNDVGIPVSSEQVPVVEAEALTETQRPVSMDAQTRKPLVGPNLWGGSQVHPDLEQLLGTLDEEERLAVQQERARRMEEQDRMFSAGKLCLVLDLDHTLLNSAKFVEIEPEWEPRLRAAEVAERSRASREGRMQRELYRFPHMGMWTKLRPGIWKFLDRASQLYELHVYTMGNKAYATEMAKLLDPTGTLFAGRVISKGDEEGDERPPKSKDLDGVLGMESAVVIIDDSSRVWPHHRENLIVVERYMYFPCSRRQFGLPGPSLLEVGHDERETDGMLASALMVIDRIHNSFFTNQRLREVDVRAILAAEQHRVLSGCCILFSRVFPVGDAQPHMHPLWRMAEQFGARCFLNNDEKVTHVVAISHGTDKVNWALSTGRYIVRPAWLEASAILYRRANERDFPVPPP